MEGCLVEGESIYPQNYPSLFNVRKLYFSLVDDEIRPWEGVAGIGVRGMDGAENGEGALRKEEWTPAAMAPGLKGVPHVVNTVKTKTRDRINVTATLCFLHNLDHLKYSKTDN